MRIEASQQFRLEQQMRLAPRIIQAMEILQLPLMALQERIEQELQSNPVLELHYQDGEGDGEAPGPAPASDQTQERGERALVVNEGKGNAEDFRRLAEFEDEFTPEMARSDAPPRPRSDSGERDRKMDAMANAPAPPQSLDDYLMEQWAFVEAPQDVKEAGKLIINTIDEDGYLRVSLEDLAAQGNNPPRLENLRRALPLVQAMDPIGVGARDLKECLLIQLRAEAQAGRDVRFEMELVNNFLRDIEMNRLLQIVRKAGKTVEQVKSAIESLSRLNPRPGSLVGQRTVPVITPDIVVDVDDDGNVVVSMPQAHVPRLYISKLYQRMARDRGTEKKARQFLRNNIRSAEWLMSAIEQRRHTILRVAEEVFAVQREFLDSGPEALRPLPMADVAKKVGVHVATVSRAVAGKYVQTPRGIFPLRMFFSGGMTTAGGEDMAWDAIKVKLREVIDAEDKSQPLNDDELVEGLKKHGITIARRTVAKYRGLLDIPPARKRRQF